MKHDESRTQTACVRWFRYAHPEKSQLLFAVPNGGQRSLRSGYILKCEGVLAGVSDLILLHPGGGFHGMCIEMKTETGRQSKEQKEWQASVEAAGFRYVLCRSVGEFVAEVENHLTEGEPCLR